MVWAHSHFYDGSTDSVKNTEILELLSRPHLFQVHPCYNKTSPKHIPHTEQRLGWGSDRPGWWLAGLLCPWQRLYRTLKPKLQWCCCTPDCWNNVGFYVRVQWNMSSSRGRLRAGVLSAAIQQKEEDSPTWTNDNPETEALKPSGVHVGTRRVFVSTAVFSNRNKWLHLELLLKAAVLVQTHAWFESNLIFSCLRDIQVSEWSSGPSLGLVLVLCFSHHEADVQSGWRCFIDLLHLLFPAALLSHHQHPWSKGEFLSADFLLFLPTHVSLYLKQSHISAPSS